MGFLLFSETASEAGQGCLHRAVGTPIRERIAGSMTADVDHKSACRTHGRNNSSAHLKHTGEVELHQPVPALQGHLKQPSCPGGAGVVDQYRWCESLTEQCCHP